MNTLGEKLLGRSDRIMKFQDFRFKPGPQTTIRRGLDWASAAGDLVPIADETGEVKGSIYVECAEVMRFYLVSYDAIDAWHAEIWPDDMRPFDRMTKITEALERCYPTPLFNATEFVTVVWFRPMEIHGKSGPELKAMLEGLTYKQGG